MKDVFNPDVEAEAERQLRIITDGAAEIVPRDELKVLLMRSIKYKKPLRVKCGIDPTTPDIHLGHLVPYRKMRQFQDLGHTGVVIIGDYTASIGDPTGKDESRQALTLDQVKRNAESYMAQVFTVLDPAKTEIRWQSEWFHNIGLKDVMMWAMETTVAKLLSHETFKNRLESGNPLCLHEMFYPVLQGIDSVFIQADVELGGTDQRFNVLMGRDYQKNRGMTQQVAILVPIIRGTCGRFKMSKSLGNYIGIKDEPFDKFGKIMSIPDDLMEEYYRYITNCTGAEVEAILLGLKQNTLHPNEIKKQLAEKVVAFFHGDQAGKEMREKFEDVFKKGQVPDDAFEHRISGGETLFHVLSSSGLFESNADIKRMFKQNAVSLVDGDKLSDMDLIIDDSYRGKSLRIGKRKFIRFI